MKIYIIKTLPLIILAFSFFTNAGAQTQTSLEKVKSELEEVSEKEINAFKTGDCDALDSFIDDKATLYMNGRKVPGKKMLISFCERIPRPFEKPSLIKMEYLPLSTHSGYVIRTMEFSKDEEVYKKEIVTKIWLKGDSGWKMVHLHSTIKEE